ncbi:MAG: PAS domain-containing protein [Kordiimonas sp.]
MSRVSILPVEQANHFGPDEIIVSKTDLKGRITYANDVFCRLAEMPTSDLIGMPHSIIRHPDMPRTIFRLLWDALGRGEEIFAYVKNMAKSGRYYWVFAHVTPSFDKNGHINGYHSNRRFPNPKAIQKVSGIYRDILKAEQGCVNAKDGLAAGHAFFIDMLSAEGKDYSEFVWALENGDV